MEVLKTYLFLFSVSILFLVVPSCKKDSHDQSSPATLGYDYYPLAKNKYVIYDVEEIKIDVEVGIHDTMRYQLKELLTDTIFSKDSLEKQYILERFIRQDSTKLWDIKNVWQVKQSRIALIRVEDNIPIVKQVYPMIKDQTWNIHRYDTLPEKISTLLSIDNIDTIRGFIFQKTAQTVQKDFESYYQKQYETEKYVREIGLVYKQVIDVESQSKNDKKPVDVNKPIMSRITMGTIVTWKIYSHN